jgi:mycothiol synthase
MADVADVLEAAERGARLWVRGLGRSMLPLIRGGDPVRVQRCSHGDLRVGDVAVLRRSSGGLTAQVVIALEPLKTASLLGVPDLGGYRVLGRVVALRRGPLVVPLPRVARRGLVALQRAVAWSYRHDIPQIALGIGRGALASRPTAALRRQWLGPFEVRRLGPEDLDAVLAFAQEYLTLSSAFLERQLLHRWTRQGGAVGAFGAHGKLYAFAFLDEYRQEGADLDGWWIRSVYIAPAARRLGLGGRMLDALCALGREQGIGEVFADVLADNPDSLALVTAHGFADASADVARAVERALGQTVPVRVLSRRLR